MPRCAAQQIWWPMSQSGQPLPSQDFCGTAALPLNVLQNSH
jgi:hypothetical protein